MAFSIAATASTMSDSTVGVAHPTRRGARNGEPTYALTLHGVRIPVVANRFCHEILAPHVCHALIIHLTGCKVDATLREHDFLICPAALVPHRTGDGFIGAWEGDSEVKALYVSYLLFGISRAWADPGDSITRRCATHSKDCECGAAVDKFHDSKLHSLVIGIVLDNA